MGKLETGEVVGAGESREKRRPGVRGRALALSPLRLWATIRWPICHGTAGNELLDTCQPAEAYTVRVESLRDVLEVVDGEITMLAERIREWLDDEVGYRAIQAIQAIPGVGRSSPRCSWPRSATCPGSQARGTCARGPG